MEKPDENHPILNALKGYVDGTWDPKQKMPLLFPPPIAKTLGFALVAIDLGKATIKLKTDMEKHANPMGTLHGGVLGDIGDAAIGMAHATTLLESESFTSVDIRTNFFRPVWSATLYAKAEPVKLGKTISYYECKIEDEKGRLVAVVTSSVMTLRGETAKGR